MGALQVQGVQGKMGCAHLRKMRTPQAQGRIGLRAICELLKQSGKITSAGLAVATPGAHVFSRNLSCIFWEFIISFMFIYRVAQAVTRPDAPVKRAHPKQAARVSVGASPRRGNIRQLSVRAQQTLRGYLHTKRNIPLRGVQMWLPEVWSSRVIILSLMLYMADNGRSDAEGGV